jgi:molybdate transport system substrate-binding protein
VNRRKLTVIVSVVLVVVFFAVVSGLYVYMHRGKGSAPLKSFTQGGSAGSGNSNAISIFAPNDLSIPLQQVTTIFQQENPGTAFQFTLGSSAELQKRIATGQRPDIYIDSTAAIALLKSNANARPASPPAPFGYDFLQLAAGVGNPKGVNGLDVFGGGNLITGICAPELLCGRVGTRALQTAGVNAAPKIVSSNIGELTDGIKSGRIDAVLMLRTELRSVLTATKTIKIAQQPDFRVDYQMVQFNRSAKADPLILWTQGSPSARQALRTSGLLSYWDG